MAMHSLHEGVISHYVHCKRITNQLTSNHYVHCKGVTSHNLRVIIMSIIKE